MNGPKKGKSPRVPQKHPARFSPEIISYFAKIIPPGTHLHDPFAGTGTRLGRLADALGCSFSGTELEQSFIEDHRVVCGNSTDPATYPDRPYWIVTSPVYPNGIADHFEAKDGSERNTYRQSVAHLEGKDRPLHPDNQARWGYRGTKRGGRSIKRATYWDIAERCVKHWGGAEAVVLNVSDFKSLQDIEPLVEDWIVLLESNGWRATKVEQVRTRRYKNGADGARDERVETETVATLVRAA